MSMNTVEFTKKQLKGRKIADDRYQDLMNAKKLKDDEWYTDYHLIAQELDMWKEKYPEVFKGKRIICPCDWDILDSDNCYSMTVTFEKNEPLDPTDKKYNIKKLRWTANRVKKISYSLWENDEMVEKILTDEEARAFVQQRLKCNFFRYLISIGRSVDIESVTASGYDPAKDRGISFEDVNYDDYDLVITNPPFSKMNEFLDIMNNKYLERKNSITPFNYIILAPMMNRVNPNVGLKLMLHTAFFGFNVRFAMVKNDGKTSCPKSVSVDWITSLPQAQDERNKSYENSVGVILKDYINDIQIMPEITMKDGSHPYRVTGSRVLEDFNVWQFIPIHLLDKIDWRKYEMYGTGFKGYYNRVNIAANPFAHKATNEMIKDENGKQGFHGWVIRRVK